MKNQMGYIPASSSYVSMPIYQARVNPGQQQQLSRTSWQLDNSCDSSNEELARIHLQQQQLTTAGWAAFVVLTASMTKLNSIF